MFNWKTAGFVAMLILLMTVSVAAGNIGYVDYELLFNAHPEYLTKNQEYQITVDQYTREFETKAEEIQDQEQFTELVKYYDGILAEVEEELRTFIINSVLEYIAIVAEKNEISVVLANTIVLYGGTDLTQQIIEEMYGDYGISVPSYLRIQE